jgi:hypothetical protein
MSMGPLKHGTKRWMNRRPSGGLWGKPEAGTGLAEGLWKAKRTNRPPMRNGCVANNRIIG